jgi:5-methylcytosine-specific restriction endonuclease McrA
VASERRLAKEAAKKVAPPKQPPERLCLHCGLSAGKGWSVRYCSKDCRYQAFKKRRPDAIERGRAYSRTRYKAGNAYKRDLTPRACRGCNEVFAPVPGDARRIYCSTSCGYRHNRREAQKKNPSHQTFRRRARRFGVDYQSGISWRKVMDRHGDQCALCGFAVPAIRSQKHPLSPTIDHIVPMSKGGGHVWDNVQLAHRICNSYKCADADVPMAQTASLLAKLEEAGVVDVRLAQGQVA